VKTIITLDVLADTMQWIAWGEHFAPLSGHQGKIQKADANSHDACL
jgi:hypothetical protein